MGIAHHLTTIGGIAVTHLIKCVYLEDAVFLFAAVIW